MVALYEYSYIRQAAPCGGGAPARQVQILGEISKGLTDEEISRTLRLRPRTVAMHVDNALAALDCRSRAEAVHKAGELGVLGRRVPYSPARATVVRRIVPQVVSP
jgi:DNA-binding NarL/FixJ family response regulator